LLRSLKNGHLRALDVDLEPGGGRFSDLIEDRVQTCCWDPFDRGGFDRQVGTADARTRAKRIQIVTRRDVQRQVAVAIHEREPSAGPLGVRFGGVDQTSEGRTPWLQ